MARPGRNLEELPLVVVCYDYTKETVMDKDRAKGAGRQAKGSVKEAAGKATGDKSLQGKGKADKAEGRVQSVFGKVKDKIRSATRRD